MTTPMIGIQLDLKGVVFREDYAPRLLADLASQGINTILVEYEDVFPFDGIDLAFDAASRWSRKRLDSFLAAAAANGLEVIPLQQCLGHLEYVLRWQPYAPLAENQAYPSTIALGNPKARALVKEMLTQMLAAHPDSRYVHLGMDEAHALHQAAAKAGRHVLELFVEWLEELLPIVEAAGKTPVIWSDMLEDNYTPGLLDKLRERLVVCTWDYGSQPGLSPRARLRKTRVSREWLDEPANPLAPAIGDGTPFIEDLPDDALALLAPYRNQRYVRAFFQVDMWTKLGFRVLGATAIRSSSHGAILPRYTEQFGNIRGFAEASRGCKQLGIIGTSWARGTTFCPPNFPIEVAWPAIAAVAEAMGATPQPFFGEVPRDRLNRLWGWISRCRQDWSLEGKVLAEIAELTPLVTAHRHEWTCLELMVRTLQLRKRADFAALEVETFRAAVRLISPEWQRRLDEQAAIQRELAALRQQVEAHFGQANAGAHFVEWLDDLYVVPSRKLDECTAYCRARLAEARQHYGW